MLRNKRNFSVEEKAKLWERYDAGDKSAFTELTEAYLSLIEIIAVKMKSNLPDGVEIDDLISDGYFGLADAVEKYDASKGYKFETYATFRIKGAITDKLREYDPVSRHYRQKFKQLNAAVEILADRLQRSPTTEELSEELDWDIDEVEFIKAFYHNSFTVNIDEQMTDSTHETFSLAELIPDVTIGDNEFFLQEQEISVALVEAMALLTEVESIIIYWKHFDGVTLNEIAERISLKPSRVSRIYSNGIEKIRKHIMS